MKLPNTIIHPASFIRSKPVNSDGVFDWAAFTIFDGVSAFPRGITPMDIDFNVEINRHFLMMESKDEGVPIPEGQKQALYRLVDKGNITLVFIWGKLIPTSWSIETRDNKIMTIVQKFGGAIVKDLGPIARLNERSCDCAEVFKFCDMWAKAIA